MRPPSFSTAKDFWPQPSAICWLQPAWPKETSIFTYLDQADFTDKERALIRFARKANLAANDVSDEEFLAVRDKGAGDAQIIEALGVMEVFTAFNKFLDVLEVELGW